VQGIEVSLTPADLCEIEEIKQLKARYFRYLDTKQWDRLREVFLPDAIFEGTHRPLHGADEFVAANRSRFANAKTVHHGHMPEIRLLGPGLARGIWAMFDWVEFDAAAVDGADAEVRDYSGYSGYGHYEEEYRKLQGEWRISRLRLKRLRVESLPGPVKWHDLPAGRLQSGPGDWLLGAD